MKKILYFIILTLCFSMIFSVAVSAEEAQTEDTPAAEVVDTESEATFFARIYEAFINNKTDVYTIAGSVALFVLSIILKKDLGSSSRSIVDGIATVLTKTSISEKQQEKIVGGLNEMVDGYEKIKEQSDETALKMTEIVESNKALDAKITEAFNLIVTLIDKEILQNAEVMDVLSSVYVNNKAITQGVKDYVTLKRTENAKLVQEASALIHSDTTEGGEAV